MVLHELHVAQRHACTKGHAHTVAGQRAGVGVLAEYPAGAAGGHDDGVGVEGQPLATGDFHGQQAPDVTILDQQVGAEELVVAADLRILERGLEEGVQDVKAAAVGGEPGARGFHAAEVADVDAAVVLAAPRTAPLLELDHLFGTVLHEVFDDILLAEPVATGDGVVEVVVEAVVVADDAGGAPFGHDGVRAHGNDLGDQGDGQARVVFGGSDGSAQSGAATAQYDDVCCGCVHVAVVF